MEPDIIVANFEDCPLKPYVSYKAEEINQSKFTANQLFNATYGPEIAKKFKNNEPIPKSLLEYDEDAARKAKNDALKTGADLMTHKSYFGRMKLDE